jgi:hypothetical protein
MGQVLRRFNQRPGATEAAIVESERQLNAAFPTDYVDFLKVTNRGEGFIGHSYPILWSAEELGKMNEAYEVERYAPGLLIFGSDGGGEAFGFDRRAADWPIVQIPFVGMDWEYADLMGDSFDEFLNRLNERD